MSQDNDIPEADHVDIVVDELGRLLIRLFDEEGRLFAIAPFSIGDGAKVALKLSRAAIDAFDVQTYGTPGQVH